MPDDANQTTANLPAEVVEDVVARGAWRVEKLDSDGDGGVDVTIFSGPDAEQRAREYAAWKYGVQLTDAKQTTETWAEEVARLGWEIAERQARLERLICGDPRERVTVPPLSQEDLWRLYVRS